MDASIKLLLRRILKEILKGFNMNNPEIYPGGQRVRKERPAKKVIKREEVIPDEIIKSDLKI